MLGALVFALFHTGLAFDFAFAVEEFDDFGELGTFGVAAGGAPVEAPLPMAVSRFARRPCVQDSLPAVPVEMAGATRRERRGHWNAFERRRR